MTDEERTSLQEIAWCIATGQANVSGEEAHKFAKAFLWVSAALSQADARLGKVRLDAQDAVENIQAARRRELDASDDRIIALEYSLSWILTFLDEHPHWWVPGEPEDGAEYEWQYNAKALLNNANQV